MIAAIMCAMAVAARIGYRPAREFGAKRVPQENFTHICSPPPPFLPFFRRLPLSDVCRLSCTSLRLPFFAVCGPCMCRSLVPRSRCRCFRRASRAVVARANTRPSPLYCTLPEPGGAKQRLLLFSNLQKMAAERY